MAKAEKGQWVTIKGRHVFIREGESAADAINRSIAEENEKKKQEQIAQNKAQAETLAQSHKGQSPMQTILDAIKKGGRQAGDVLNELTSTGDVFVFETPDGEIYMFGKTYNDEYYPLNFGGKGVAQTKLDSGDIVKKIAKGGSWSLHPYGGELHWTEKKQHKYDSGNRFAVILPKLPTNARIQGQRSNIEGYDVYDLSDAPKFFSRVAIRRRGK